MNTPASLMTAAAIALVLAAPPAPAQEPVTISTIEVQADIAGIGSAAAMDYWRDLPGDLEDAILRELLDAVSAEGLTLRVAVDTLALEEAFEDAFAGPNARLAGQVQLIGADGAPVTGVWSVAATASQAEAMLPEGVDVTVVERTGVEFYEAVVDAFARGVAQAFRGDGPRG